MQSVRGVPRVKSFYNVQSVRSVLSMRSLKCVRMQWQSVCAVRSLCSVKTWWCKQRQSVRKVSAVRDVQNMWSDLYIYLS